MAFHTVPLTVGYEIPIGRHWSIYSDYTITVPWHAWNNNSECAELMHWDLGTRWYPWSRTRVLKGWYASLKTITLQYRTLRRRRTHLKSPSKVCIFKKS